MYYITTTAVKEKLKVKGHIKNIHLHSCKHKTVTLKLTLTLTLTLTDTGELS